MTRKDGICKIAYGCLLILPVFFSLGLVTVETPEILRSGDLSYQWLWFSRLGFLFTACAFWWGISAMCGKQTNLPRLYVIVV